MDVQQQITSFKEFIEKYYHEELLNKISKGEQSLLIDFAKLAQFNPLMADLLLDSPEETISACQIAVEHFDILEVTKDFKVRVFNLPKSTTVRIRDIRTKHIGKLVQMEGVIRQTSDIRPQVVSARYECPSCGNIIPLMMLDSQFKEPTACGCGRRGKFRLLSKEMIDCQHLKLEEPTEIIEGHEQPRTINVFLSRDLTSPRVDRRNVPGSRVRMTGIIREVPVILKTGSKSTVMDIIFDAIYILPLSEDYEDISISKEEIEEFHKLSKTHNLFDKLIKSYAPSIQGYDKIKLAILLQMFSAVKKVDKQGKLERRENFHILLLGDPSTAKSQLIKYGFKVAPKFSFCSGSGSSGRGLTAAVVKDEFLGGYVLQAGAAVLANKGMLFADEINLMSEEDRNYLNECLESQTITIHKATIHATLSAEVSMLAAGNPKNDRFSVYEPIPKQINLPAALLSRFDLVFIIKDIPEPEHDGNIFDKIYDAHLNKSTIEPALSPMFLKKYISYARQKIKPKLTEEVRIIGKEIYLKLRARSSKDESGQMNVSITARQGEGLIRLAEACAKARLSETVDKQDIEMAEELIMFSLNQTILDPETGKFDIDRISSSTSHSQRTKLHFLVELIRDAKEGIHIDEIERIMKGEGATEIETEEFINRLRHNGEIMENPRNIYHLLH